MPYELFDTETHEYVKPRKTYKRNLDAAVEAAQLKNTRRNVPIVNGLPIVHRHYTYRPQVVVHEFDQSGVLAKVHTAYPEYIQAFTK